MNEEDNIKLSLKGDEVLKNTKESSLENKEPFIKSSINEWEDLKMVENFINLMNSQSMENVKLE